jgi:succinate dehydrogenase hydrophobic anchor subunit
MQISSSASKAQERSGLWLYKIVSGAFIVILLGIHLVVNHLVAPGGLLTYADVVQYYTHPIVPAMEIIFLILVISHALIGLRGIVLDLNPSESVLHLVETVFVIVGVGFSIYGTWVILTIVQRGLSQ